MEDDWLNKLIELVQCKPLVVFQFDDEEWSSVRGSRRGANQFTIARSHELFGKIRVPTACLIFGKDGAGTDEVYFGLASSRSAVTTLESRIKVQRALHIQPSSKADVLRLVTDKRHARYLRGIRLAGSRC